MSTEDQITYGRAARLRVALAAQAADVADTARGMVAPGTDSFASDGEFVEMASQFLFGARELLTLAVVYERRRDVSREITGATLRISRQAAHERYAEAEKRLTDALIEAWLTGDDPGYTGLPDGAAEPPGTASLLDRWAVRHMQQTDGLAHRPANDPERARPVSAKLPPMDTLEHSTLVMTAGDLIMDRRRAAGRGSDDDGRIRQLELGLARRKVELYERMSIEDAGERGRTGTDPGQLRDLLADARARLAELEGQEAGRQRRAERWH